MDRPAGNNQYLLSLNFKDWYGRMLPGLILAGDDRHPHFQLQPRPNINDYEVSEKKVAWVSNGELSLESDVQIWASSNSDKRWVVSLQKMHLERYLMAMPAMTSSDVLLDNDKVCKLMTVDEINWYCVVELKDPAAYIKSLNAISKISEDFAQQYNTSIGIRPVTQWIIVCEDSRYYFVTPFCGQTLAQKWPEISVEKQRVILESMRNLLIYFEEKGLYWRDFAPRNMLLPNEDEIILIDFEHLIETHTLPVHERIVLDKYRKIWFGDMLSVLEIDYLFDGLPLFRTENDNDALHDADSLEWIYFGQSKICFEQRLALLEMIAGVERKHESKKVVISGHRLGLYMSDFLDVEFEAALYVILRTLPAEAWPTLLRALQECIDFDQLNYIMNLYNRSVVTHVAASFLGEMQRRVLYQNTLEQEVTQWIQQHIRPPGDAGS